MLSERKHLIVNHSGFLLPVRAGMESLGLTMVDDVWDPSNSLLEQSIACHVWFYDCLRHPWKVWRLKQRLKRFNVPLFAWNRDAPHYLNRRAWRLNWLNRARLLDIYASHSLIDQRQFADTTLYLPNAADINTYNLRGSTANILQRMRSSASYQYDVSFFGGMNGHRYKEDAEREHFFSLLGEQLSARGIRFLFREAEGMSLDEQIRLIQASRINLNYGARCEYRAVIASGLPERCYGIPACGGFLLCDKRIHARDDFTVGENWAEFDGIEDCVEKIDFWLAHFDQTRDLAERCYHHVMNHHTYTHRAKTLLLALLDWHKCHGTN